MALVADPTMVMRVHDPRTGVVLGEINDATNVSYSTVLNKAGVLTFDLALTHPKARADLLRYRNVFVIHSNELGDWSGYLTKLDWSNGDTVTVTVYNIEMVLSLRRSTPLKFQNVYPGEIVKYLVTQANQKGPTGLSMGDIFMGGIKISLDLGTENIYDKLVQVIEDAKLEYRIVMLSPGNWELDVYERVGSDLTDQVVVVMGYDTDGPPEYSEDWTRFANSILAVGQEPTDPGADHGLGSGQNDGWAHRPKATWTDPDSVSAWGLAEDVIDVNGISDPAVLLQKAKEEVDTRKYPLRQLTFTLTNRRDWWSQFEEGDIICAQVPLYGFTGLVVPFKVQGRAVDAAAFALTVTGEIVEGQKAQVLKMYSNAHYGSGGGTGSPY